MYKVDLHTHSVASPDGSLKLKDYRAMLDSGRLDLIAVTDHDRIDYAQKLNQELGDQIVVGQEITTRDGEIIGLYLKKVINPGMTAQRTVEAIRSQGGLVYIPHPFERLRKGVQEAVLNTISETVDIMEIHNGRASLDAKPDRAQRWGQRNHVAGASSSDAHGRSGWGKTYTLADSRPGRDNLVELLLKGEPIKGNVGPLGRLYPKLNRFTKWIRHD